MIQRYIEGGYGVSEMEEDAQGEWVKYEDYTVLELKVLAALSHLERASSTENRVLCSGYVKMALRILRNGD